METYGITDTQILHVSVVSLSIISLFLVLRVNYFINKFRKEKQNLLNFKKSSDEYQKTLIKDHAKVIRLKDNSNKKKITDLNYELSRKEKYADKLAIIAYTTHIYCNHLLENAPNHPHEWASLCIDLIESREGLKECKSIYEEKLNDHHNRYNLLSRDLNFKIATLSDENNKLRNHGCSLQNNILALQQCKIPLYNQQSCGTYCVYAIVDYNTKKPLYIGYTGDFNRRVQEHKDAIINGIGTLQPVHRKIRELRRSVDFLLIESGLSNAEAAKAYEAFYIRMYKLVAWAEYNVSYGVHPIDGKEMLPYTTQNQLRLVHTGRQQYAYH